MTADFLSQLNLNWVDFIIIVVLAFYAAEGYSVGFVSSLLDLVSFIASFIIGLKAYSPIGKLIQNVFSISSGFANAIGFLTAASIPEIIIGIFSRHLLYTKYFSRINFKGPSFKIIDKFSGALLGIFSGLVLFSFILTVVVGLPVSVFLKRSVSSSRIGSFLIFRTSGLEKELNKVFGGAVNDTLNFLTIEPKSEETVNLNFRTQDIKIDPQAEERMLILVNKERTSGGLESVVSDIRLKAVARAHCEDMFRRGYFSHYTLEGLSPFDRMAQADIDFAYAGENLALAPNADMAMQGFMRSPGHKANILSSNFGKLGVGAIDGGIYGQMFCQEFTD